MMLRALFIKEDFFVIFVSIPLKISANFNKKLALPSLPKLYFSAPESQGHIRFPIKATGAQLCNKALLRRALI